MELTILTDEKELKKFLLNLIKYTAPCLAVFFGQLALGVEPKAAGLVALYTLYALLSDYFKKLGE